ncbi:MAG TPA: outer membrane protein assembly factor BamA, partial [Nitrospiraceae bacterium]|nr:outer membrane protein assembly factor BamA [Nitrospiraceae bacterium]
TYGDTVTSSAITVSLARDSRDYFLDPKKGSRNSIFVEYAGGPLGGDPSFIKSVVDSGWYFPLFGDTSFMLRGRFGYAASLIDKPLPSGERFFVGGTSTVRGFKYGGAGPVEPVYDDLASPTPTIIDYTRIGGTRELIFNAEFNFPIVAAARLKGVLFYDIGKAFDDGESIRLSQLRHAVGWGFRWFTPVGPLRFEWGYIVNQQTNDLASQFEFSIGTIF